MNGYYSGLVPALLKWGYMHVPVRKVALKLLLVIY